MEGLQGWMAEIERKQGRMTYFGAAAVLIAILAAGAALYFGITAKNDSGDAMDDLDSLETKVDGLARAVNQSTKETQDTINNSISQLQSSIADLQKKQAKNAANISTLQSQVQAPEPPRRRRHESRRGRRAHAHARARDDDDSRRERQALSDAWGARRAGIHTRASSRHDFVTFLTKSRLVGEGVATHVRRVV